GSTWRHWIRLGDGLPHVQVFDLHYDYTDDVLLAGTLGRGAWTLSNPFSSGQALLAASLPQQSLVDSLSLAQVQPMLGEAVARWAAAGADLSTLGAIDIRIADLGGATLGLASGHTIWLDDNAAGWGWFVDPTPHDDSEFSTPGNQGEMHRIDLLTALEHELGHLLGYDHTDDGLMADTLAAGIRETPTAVLDQVFAVI